MYTGLLHLHSLLRWVILILAVLAIYQAFTKSNGLKKTSLWLLIAAHTTLLVGIYQWVVGNLGLKLIQASSMGEVMKNAATRFWVVEHFTGMLIGIILITIARGKVKKDNYKAASWLYVIALLIILVTIPWPFRAGIGRGWFPGMD
ncbi:MAG: hypothetical protein EAZ16_03260 [Sphingobacteriales bacterium]|jgi:hypothetical protein|nr:MAG: hypothetical protein EAZ16_03260 [Sphingobacteriales bacterium]